MSDDDWDDRRRQWESDEDLARMGHRVKSVWKAFNFLWYMLVGFTAPLFVIWLIASVLG